MAVPGCVWVDIVTELLREPLSHQSSSAPLSSSHLSLVHLFRFAGMTDDYLLDNVRRKVEEDIEYITVGITFIL